MAVRAPPNGHAYTHSTSFGLSDRQTSVYPGTASWAGSQGGIDMGNGDLRPEPRYRHIKDLQAKADAAHDFVGIHTPVCVRRLILAAEKLLRVFGRCCFLTAICSTDSDALKSCRKVRKASLHRH